MSPIRSLRAGLRSLFHGNEVDGEIDDEMRDYIDRATAENIRNGMTPDAAARAARMEVGGTATKERVRTGGWESNIEFLLQDLRYALRGLRRNPAFALIAILTLALGIGANTAMFSVVNAVMLRPLPWRDSDRLVQIWTDDVRRSLHNELTAYLTISDWREGSRAFNSIAYYTAGRVAPRSNDPGGERGRSRIAFASGNLFSTLGVAPAMGRAISVDDEHQRARVAIISHDFWQRWFKGAPDIIGRTMSFDDASKETAGGLTIIGVMPPGFYFPDQQTDIWTPATTYWRFDRESTERFPGWARRWKSVARLKDGVSVREARDDLARVGRQLAAAHTSNDPDFPGFQTTVLPVLDAITGANLQSALWVLLGAVSLVLLVACVNVANLLLARGAARQQEIAVRRALGAGRGRLVRQLVIESMVLALVGGAVGVLMAAWGTQLVGNAASAYVPRINEIAIDWRVLLFAFAAALASGLAFGLAPALRLSAADANEALKEGARGTGRASVKRSRDMLVIAECALAIVLLTGAGLLLRSLGQLQAISPGFDASHVLMVRIEMPQDPPPLADASLQTSRSEMLRAGARDAMAAQLSDRVAALPGVTSVGFTDDMFINAQGNKSITIPGKGAENIPAGELNDGAVAGDFIGAVRVPLRRGRALTHDDVLTKIRALWQPITTDLSLAEKERRSIPEPVLVNEAFVQRFFPGEDPIGRKFCIDPENKTYWYEIVGVVGDMHRSGLERHAIPEFYGPWFPSPNGRGDVLVRASGDPLALAASVRREIVRAIPGVSVVSISTVDAGLGGFSALRRLQTSLLSTFALLAVVLAAIGIFGLVHYAVAERTREIGVRVALGATPADVQSLVIGQGMRTPLIGIGVGLLASAALTRLMSSLLFNIGANDPVTFAAVAFVLAGVAAAACFIAARRALKIDPLLALRSA